MAAGDVKFPAGPFQRLEQAKHDFAAAVWASTTAEFKDAALALERAAAQVEKLTNPAPGLLTSGPFQRLQQAQDNFKAALVRGTQLQINDAALGVQQAQATLDRLTTRLADPLPRGPFARLQQAQRDFQTALQRGTQIQVQDAALALKQAQAQVSRVTRKKDDSFAGLLGDLFQSSRFSASIGGVHLMPLVNRLSPILNKAFGGGKQADPLDAVIRGGQGGGSVAAFTAQMGAAASATGQAAAGLEGVGGAAGGVGVALAGIAVAANLAIEEVKVFATVIRQAVEALNEFRAGRLLSGGTTGEVARLGAFGIAPGQVAGESAAFRRGITPEEGGDTLAMARAQQLGVPIQIGRPFGPVDEAKILSQALQGLEKQFDRDTLAVGREKAELNLVRDARLLGLDAHVKDIALSKEVRQAREADAEATRIIFDPKAQQDAADMAAQFARLGKNLELVGVAIAKAFFGDWIKGVGDIADVIREIAAEINAHPDIARQAVDVIFPIIGVIDALLTFGGRIGAVSRVLSDNLNHMFDPIKLAQNWWKAWEIFLFGVKSQQNPQQAAADAQKAAADAQNALTRQLQTGLFGGGPRTQGAADARLKGWYADQAAAGHILGRGGVTL